MVDVPILNMGYKIFGRWAIDVLRDSGCRLEGVERDAASGRLYRFSLDQRPNVLTRMTSRAGFERRIRFWLSPTYGYLAVRSETEAEATSPRVHELLVLRTLQFRRNGQIWFPVKGTKRSYDLAGGGRRGMGGYDLAVSGVELNRVPDSLFEPRLGPGTLFKESETDQHWRIGSRGQWIAYQPLRRRAAGRMPIGWLFMVSLTSLVMAAGGALLRWRRRPA